MGELSTIVTSILLTSTGINNYLITDDRAARKLIEKIHQDKKLENILGGEMKKIDCTGTIGLLRRLKTLGILSDDTCNTIADDLLNSTFGITPELLGLLRN